MDQTKRPITIPPVLSLYAEKHKLFDLYHGMLQQLLIHKPDDPIKFLIEMLEKDNVDVPAIIIQGPPASGKHTIGSRLAEKLKCPHLTMKSIIQDSDRQLREKAEYCLSENQPIPTELWTKLVKNRLELTDCHRKGWVLSGFPQNRDQAMALQTSGIHPHHVIQLQCPDSVLIERASGKRIDSETGGIYHINFDPPTDNYVADRLIEVTGNTEMEMVERLSAYNRFIIDLAPCYSSVTKCINADQPVADVLYQSFDFVRSPARSVAPRNPRVILLGPPGSGRDTQASLLASKYDFVNVNCGNLIKQAIARESKTGMALRNYVERHMPVPDAMLLKLLKDRLSEIDCVTRGWILHGYPRTRGQAEQLHDAGFEANRVFFFEISNVVVQERLTNRLTDPVSGRRYHKLYNPPTDEVILKRLVNHPRDQSIEVNKRLARFSTFHDELHDFYGTLSQQVNADQDIHTVFETVESFIVEPIPKQFS